MQVEEYLFLKRHLHEKLVSDLVLSGCSPREYLEKHIEERLKFCDSKNTPEMIEYRKVWEEAKKECSIFYRA